MEFDIERIAKLGSLNLKPDEKAKLTKDMEAILGYVKSLDELDVSDVQPTSHVLNLENVYRKDEVFDAGTRDKVLKYAPEREGNFFKVPKVVNREE